MRKLLVVGATGGTGRRVVDTALARGWRVTALVRDPAKLKRSHEGLTIVSGGVTDPETLRTVVVGQDAVICTLGQQRGTPATLMRDAAAALILAMKATGVKRLLALSGAAVRVPGDPPRPWMQKVGAGIVGWVMPRLLEDTQGYADRIRISGLDWTLVRPMWLTDGPGGRPIRVGSVLDLGVSAGIDRRDVATFLVDQVDSDAWIRRAPMITAD